MYTNLNKFVLQTFNKLVYKQEISSHLSLLYLLDFLYNYNYNIKMQYISLAIFYYQLVNTIFHKSIIP